MDKGVGALGGWGRLGGGLGGSWNSDDGIWDVGGFCELGLISFGRLV